MKKLFKIPALLYALMLIVSSCGNETKSEPKSEAKSDADIPISITNIEKPEGWFDNNTDNAVIKNLKKISKNSQKVQVAIDDWNNKADKVLFFYTKYELSKHYGVSPTINVTLIKNIHNKTLEDLVSEGELLMEQLKNMGMEEVSLEKIGYINLNSGIKAVELKSSFKLPGSSEKVNSSIYSYFISKNLMLQLSFSDLDNDKCDDIYKQILDKL